MDLPSFCVENRRKGRSFPFLRSASQLTEKMPKSFEFGVPLSGPIMEENCFKNIHDSCNAQYKFQEDTRSQECHSKKSCFDNFHKFSHFSFSKVVGGFVGSKSHGGSAFRESHQVWDVIFRQVVDSACQATMNNNAQQYISISEAVSQSIFGQLNNSTSSSLDFSSFILSKRYDFFSNNKSSQNMQVSSDNLCQKTSEKAFVDKQVSLNNDPSNTQSVNVHTQKTNEMKIQQPLAKQSYADVAKTFAAIKSEASNKSDKYQCVPVSSQSYTLVNNRNSGKGNEKYRKRRQNVICYTQPSYNNSSQNQHRKSKILPDKCEEQIPSKFARNKFVNSRHSRTENSNSCKERSKDGSVSVLPAKDSKDQEERKRRYSKYRNYNMREKERKIVDQQVHDDVVFACNMPQQECQNWRCDHNRQSRIHNSGRVELDTRRRHNRTKNYKQQSRLHSPPPRTFVSDSAKVSKSRTDDPCSQKEVEDILKIREMCRDTLCNVEKSELGSSLNSISSGDNSESSFSSSPGSSSVVLPLRPRVSSECSLDSEDSSVVFERDDCDFEIESDSDSDFDSVKDYSSECDSEDDCDEVDFCYETPSVDTNTVAGSPFADVYSPLPDRLKDINEKWHKEHNVFSKNEKIPKKVHFPGPEKLAKVHHMIHWPYAYREARRGPWEEIGRDRCRFQMRIERAEKDLSQVLDPQHRRRIWEERMCDLGNT